MPLILHYTERSFKRPRPISLSEYNYLKVEISKNHLYKIDNEDLSYWSHFPASMYWTVFMIPICVIVFSICLYEYINARMDDFSLIYIGIIIPVGIYILGAFKLLYEGPSFTQYRKDRIQYFSEMKLKIQKSDKYLDFAKRFYNEDEYNSISANIDIENRIKATLLNPTVNAFPINLTIEDPITGKKTFVKKDRWEDFFKKDPNQTRYKI